MSKPYPQEQILFLEAHCHGMTCREITEIFNHRFGTNKSFGSIRGILRGRGMDKHLTKEPSYTDEQLTFLFVNKDNTYPVLTEMFNNRFKTNKTVDAVRCFMRGKGWGKYKLSGRGDYQKVYIKGKPIRLDIYVWECVNGPLKPGYTVIHLDNDKNNNQIANLMAAPSHTKAMFVLSGGGDAPKALAPALYAKVMLQGAIRKIEKGSRQ
ncbi:HNH endonuclease [Serratia fonticola]|uniref:HNH endonuclease n=1 Tax=Serratia fonticola TaxID=47917 RepID=A0AAW3WU02_SERFO|nr:HNH endonuclease [Serratia fonticola]MBC3214261.1 HNH endonuclease [Serratia fonticola]NYA13652.1 HNH endonuclease [Serratia fonticola]NYA35112.1 HNH endonuclease [Serratia fonticola]